MLSESFYSLWNHISRGRQKQVYMAVVLMIMGSFIELLAIGSLLPFLGLLTNPDAIFSNNLAKPILEYFDFHDPDELILPMLCFFIGLIIFSGAFRVLLLAVQTRLSHLIGGDLSRKMYLNTLMQLYLTHTNSNTAELIGTISVKSTELVYGFILPALIIVSSSFVLFIFLSAGLFFNPLFILAVILFAGVIYGFSVFLSKRRLTLYSKVINEGTGLALRNLHEGLGGIREVILNGNQNYVVKEYGSIDTPLRLAKANAMVVATTPRYVLETMMIVLVAFIAYVASFQSSEGFLAAIPILGAFALAGQRLLPIASSIYTGWATIRSNYELSDAILRLLNQRSPLIISVADSDPVSLRTKIELKEISFSYPDQDIPILSNIDLTIIRGTRIGFMGTTGSGKSTLINIFMGLLTPGNGSIIVDGINITDSNVRGWQGLIAHVPQSIYLADSSIAQNIAFGVPEAEIDFQLVEKSAMASQISETIQSWPDGYNTLVGERGVRLSGGQLQRIGIARALYKRAEIIIFDEATSALDNKTERQVMDAIDSLDENLTIIIIAHRLSTLKNCNEIYEINRGKLMRKNVGITGSAEDGLK